jgi:hypothetical protein
MAAGPAQPPSPEQPQDGRSYAGAQSSARGAGAPEQPPVAADDEPYGPLTIARLRKDDGRSLILYGHDGAQAELDDSAASQPDRQDSPA